MRNRTDSVSTFRTPSNRRRLWIVLSCAMVLAIAGGALPVRAEGFTFTPEIPLPGLFDKDNIPVDSSLMSQYIRAVFIYFIWVVGTVATFMVIYGGVRWVAAAGNSGQIKEARSIIDNAVIGIIIALTSVVLLNIINPRLTELSLPGLKSVTKEQAKQIELTSYTDFYLCSARNQVPCGEARALTITDPNTGAVTESRCVGTFCRTVNNVHSICQFGYDAASKQYQTGTCETQPKIKTMIGSAAGAVTTIPVQAPPDINHQNIWTGVVQPGKGGPGTEYIVNACGGSSVPIGFILGKPTETLPPYLDQPPSSVFGHTRLVPRGCPSEADPNQPSLMSSSIFPSGL